MKRQIVLTKTAQRRLKELLEHLEKEWSTKVKRNFISKFENRLEIVKTNPQAFPESEIKKGLHKCVITRQTSLYFTFDSSKIYVLTVFDSRQDSNKLVQDLK